MESAGFFMERLDEMQIVEPEDYTTMKRANKAIRNSGVSDISKDRIAKPRTSDRSNIGSNDKTKDNRRFSTPNLRNILEEKEASVYKVDNGSLVPQVSAKHKNQRVRRPYSTEEIENLIAGYRRFGKNWAKILENYQFHYRTNVDLKDKFRNLVKSGHIKEEN